MSHPKGHQQGARNVSAPPSATSSDAWVYEKRVVVVTLCALYLFSWRTGRPKSKWRPELLLEQRVRLDAGPCVGLQSVHLSLGADNCVGLNVQPDPFVRPALADLTNRASWVDDNSCGAKFCYGSGDEFNFFRRRHHCRVSGKIFQDRYCDYLQPLPDRGMPSPQRVGDVYIGVAPLQQAEDLLLVCDRRTELVCHLQATWVKNNRGRGGSAGLPLTFGNSWCMQAGRYPQLARVPAASVVFSEGFLGGTLAGVGAVKGYVETRGLQLVAEYDGCGGVGVLRVMCEPGLTPDAVAKLRLLADARRYQATERRLMAREEKLNRDVAAMEALQRTVAEQRARVLSSLAVDCHERAWREEKFLSFALAYIQDPLPTGADSLYSGSRPVYLGSFSDDGDLSEAEAFELQRTYVPTDEEVQDTALDNWRNLSKHPAVTMEWVSAHPELPWSWRLLSFNPNLTLEFLLEQSANSDVFDWAVVSCHKNITPEMMLATKAQLPWAWVHVASNPNLTIEFITQHPKLWINWNYYSINPGVSMETVLNNPSMPWNYYAMLDHPHLSAEVVRLHCHYLSPHAFIDRRIGTLDDVIGCLSPREWQVDDGKWSGLSTHPAITFDFILLHRDKNWHWWSIGKHPNVTMKHIAVNLDLPWEWFTVSKNPNLRLEFVLAHREFNWHWYDISRNPGITMDDVAAHPELPWRWTGLRFNPNLTMERCLLNRASLWHLDFTLECSFDVERKEYVRQSSCRLSLLSLMDEDYNREEGVLDLCNAVDLVFQNEYLVSFLVQYV